MTLTGNKGEWSEVYALLKLIADQNLYLGDDNLQPIPDKFFPIQQVLKKEQNQIIYFSIFDSLVNINFSKKTKTIAINDFQKKAEQLLQEIKSQNSTTFSCQKIEHFLNNIYCYSLKGQTAKSADISIMINDEGKKPTLDYNVKSKLGSLSTLFNANKDGTNFIYEIKNNQLTDQEIEKINKIETRYKIQDRIKAILEKNGIIEFSQVASDIFDYNLMLIDTQLPKIIGQIIYDYYVKGINKIVELVDSLTNANPLKINTNNNYEIYQNIIKKFLMATAFGMTSRTQSKGNFDTVKRGVLMVTKKGDLLSYHIYTENGFENYLFNNTKLDKPSSSRHKFGRIYKQNNKLFIKFNLQVRFI